jgi:hypothetical protein
MKTKIKIDERRRKKKFDRQLIAHLSIEIKYRKKKEIIEFFLSYQTF